MDDMFTLSSSAEKVIVDNKLYRSFIEHSIEGIILCEKSSQDVLLINDIARELLNFSVDIKKCTLSNLLDKEAIKELMKLHRAYTETEKGRVNIISSSWEDKYVWIYLFDTSKISRMENVSRKILELNRELIKVFDTYGDDSLMVTDGKGVIEFAGAKISDTCGTPINELIGRSVYDVEKEGIFRPSVSVKVLASKKHETVIQTTKTGEELVSVGAPVINKKGEVEKVVSVTRDYSTQIKISCIIAELGNEIFSGKTEDDSFQDTIISCNEEMFSIKTMIKMVAPTKATILITGESGTGKEVVARYIHNMSDRKGKPFVKVNCGAISASIIESELFGYEEGSFTGATKGGKIGLVEAANNGILFLDEISELPLEQQVKLLHVIQEKMLIRVGGTKQINLDIRIIAATNKNLEEQVARGQFREDLFYRLNVIPLDIPPLRKRREDIPLLVKYFIKKFCETYNREMQLSRRALLALENYPWPGNIRQLENVIERIVLTLPGAIVSAENIKEILPKETEMVGNDVLDKMVRLDEALEAVEKRMILDAMDKYGTTTKAAEVLGVNQSTISRKMAKYSVK